MTTPKTKSKRSIGKIPMLSRKIRDKKYAAGLAILDLGGLPIDAVAVIADGKKWCSTPEDCRRVLQEKGLSKEEAEMFLESAIYRQALQDIVEICGSEHTLGVVATQRILAKAKSALFL